MQFDKIFSMPKISKGQGLPLRLDIFLFSHISIFTEYKNYNNRSTNIKTSLGRLQYCIFLRDFLNNERLRKAKTQVQGYLFQHTHT